MLLSSQLLTFYLYIPLFFHFLFFFFFYCSGDHRDLHSFPTRRSSDLVGMAVMGLANVFLLPIYTRFLSPSRSEEHTSELQSPDHLVCRLLLEKKKKTKIKTIN